MDYSNKYFGKSIDNLDYNDIETYFLEEKEESDKIEFKSFSADYGNLNKNLEGVIRGICAFLNSEGGLLIWGAPSGENIDGKLIFKGELSPVKEFKEKDWLINKISDSTTPLPIGINVNILEKNSDYVYVFEIQKSLYSPHQFKNTYWARLDGQTKPAPHYLVEALFKKITYPNLESYIKLDKAYINGNNYILNITIFTFNFSELQNEENVSFRLICPQGIFTRSLERQYQHMYGLEGHQLIHKDLIDILHFGAPNFHQETIAINPQLLLTKYNNKLDLMLSFGGKKSPLKFCDYTLDFSKLNLSKQDDPNYLILEMEENILVSKKQNESNLSKEDTLKKMLKR